MAVRLAVVAEPVAAELLEEVAVFAPYNIDSLAVDEQAVLIRDAHRENDWIFRRDFVEIVAGHIVVENFRYGLINRQVLAVIESELVVEQQPFARGRMVF